MATPSEVSLHDCFAELQDSRRDHLRLHNLWDIIALTICAVVCGADNWVEIEKYGLRKQGWLEQLLELPNGIPSHDTLGRVFALLDPDAFQRCFGQWTQALVEATQGRLISIDGKTLRGSADRANGRGALHLVSAWSWARSRWRTRATKSPPFPSCSSSSTWRARWSRSTPWAVKRRSPRRSLKARPITCWL